MVSRGRNRSYAPDEEVKSFLVRLPMSDYEALADTASQADRSMNSLAVDAIKEYLGREGVRTPSSTARDVYQEALDKLAGGKQ